MRRTITLTSLSIAAGIAMFSFALVASAAGPWYVTTTGNDGNDCLSVPTACLTINAAITKASPGDTINVGVGTYAENVVLNKDVTLNGAQTGVDARTRAASESIIAPASGVGIALQTGAAGATVDGFTVSGGTRSIESSSGPLDGLGILNNRLVAFTSAGIFLNDNGNDITVDKNLIDAASQTGAGGVVHLDQDAFDGFWFTNNDVLNSASGTGLFSDGTRNVGTSLIRSPKMTGNLIQANNTGVNIGRKSWEFADISGNTFKNNTFDGLQGGPADSTISGNVFDNNGRSGLALTGFGGGTDATRGAQRNTVTLNTFTGNDTEGIFLTTSQFAGTIATNVINRNGIAGNSFGLRYGGTETINAECNWWGASNGPGPIGPGSGDNVGASATIDYTSWLTTSDLANGPCNGPAPVTVTIVKYVDGQHGDATNAEGLSFPMNSCWSATNIGTGCGSFSLGPTGFNNPNPYEATTANMTSGASYSTNEDATGNNVGADCAAGKPFALVGYTTGDTYAQAASSSPATTSPAFTNITSNKWVLVWNKDCTPKLTVTKNVINDNGGTATTSDFTLFIDNATTTSGTATTTTAGSHVVSEGAHPGYTSTIGGDCDGSGNVMLAAGDSKNCTITNNDIAPATTTLKVHILKYLDGQKAVASTTSGYQFPMESTWKTANLNGGATTTGNYVLGNFHGGASDQYGADTAAMQSPANYSTHELTGGANQPLSPGATCQSGMYRLVGYSTSAASFAAAASSSVSTTTPSYFGLTSDRYVIVWNEKCPTTPPACNAPVTQTIVSDTSNMIGGANAIAVAPHPAWTATIASSTTWIWQASSTPPNATVAFEKVFTASGTILSVQLDIASDNNYKVFIDGVQVAADANVNNFQTATQDTYNLTANVTPGTHTLRIEVTNAGTYDPSGNPAGLLYKLTIVTCPPATPPTPPPPANACSLSQAPSGYTLVNGTSGNDTVTLAPNTMYKGNGGNDTITAPDGNYIICTGNGNDKITIGNGDYTINAGGGNNTVTTGNGSGYITAGSGNDIITVGTGDHTINAGGGNNTIVTGDGTQNVTVLSGNDKVTTGSGNDTIAAGGGNNTVKSGGGDDTITAGSGNDTVDGGSGTDSCSAGGGTNTVTNCP